MPPKVKITKDKIVQTALNVVRIGGEQAINARTLANILNCSTQPIFSNFATMEELRYAVAVQGHILFQKYMDQEISSGKYPYYKAHGMAYIRFAMEERELFKLLFMCDRCGKPIPADDALNNKMHGVIQESTGLNENESKLFHLEMWAYVHGIATMFATGFLDLEWELIEKMLTDAYQGLRKQYGME